MAEKGQCSSLGSVGQNGRELVCIDTYRVLDSCKDKDCFEDVRVYLTHFGQDIIERTSAIRAKSAKIVSANIDIDPVPFNRGFYQVSIKMFVKIVCEACVSPGNIQEIEGMTAVEKKIVLYGSEGNVSVFKSGPCDGGFSVDSSLSYVGNNLPIAVLETVDPILLDVKITDIKRCCPNTCCISEIPDGIVSQFGGALTDDGASCQLVVSLGVFSVVRIERPAQYLINASEYSVPDKCCTPITDDNPCKIFQSMSFPTAEFYPPSLPSDSYSDGRRFGCGRCSDQ